VIRAVVDPTGGPAHGQGAGEPGTATASAATSEDRDAIIAAAVKEVLRILRAAKER
jgi:hypothetical protein